MTTKDDASSAVEPYSVQSTTSMSTSTVSASSLKVSMLGSKSGFVIPKNKLSGSLVPIFRGSGKVEAGDTSKDETSKQVQRKTKWGADLTQDASVRKGRILAYQTRLEQITHQLKSGSLEIQEDQDSQSHREALNADSDEHLHGDKHSPQSVQPKKHELLELERREVIGEILQLNPSYKAPPDYKPLLKEAKVPVPLKAYPGYNFIGLLLGPESNTQKRLEEETGAKVQVQGIKADKREKCEVTYSDASDAQAAYEELYVHISADTYEKVDAAVALIELLVTPVSGTPVIALATSGSAAGDGLGIFAPGQQDSTSCYVMMPTGAANQGSVRSMVLPSQSGPPQFQTYAGLWYPPGASNAPTPMSGGLMPSPVGYFSPSMSNNSFRFPPSPVNPVNVPPFFGGHPLFGSVPRNQSAVVIRPQLPTNVLQQPLNLAIPPANHSIPGQQHPPTYSAMSAQPSANLSASYPASTPPVSVGSMPATRPALPPGPQHMSTTPVGPLHNRPLMTSMPSGNTPVWSTAPSPVRPNNMMQMAPPPLLQPRRPHLMLSLGTTASLPSQPNMHAPAVSRPPTSNFTPTTMFPSQSSTLTPAFSSVPSHIGPLPALAMVSSPAGPSPGSVPAPFPKSSPLGLSQTPTFMSASASVSVQGSVPTQSASPSIARPPIPVPSLPPVQASTPAPRPVPSPQPVPPLSSSGMASLHNFTPVKLPVTSPVSVPPISALKPQRPSSGDFTFQPLRAQVPASATSPRPNTQPVAQNTSQVPHSAPQTPLPQNNSQLPLAAPQPPSFRPAVQNPSVPMGSPGFPRPCAASQMGPPRGPIPLLHASVAPPSNPTNLQQPPRPTAFPNSMPPMAQTGPSSFFTAPQAPNLPGPMLTRPSTMMPPLPPNHPRGFMAPNQHLSNVQPGYVPGKPASSPGGNQTYDPFSPTSIASVPSQLRDDQTKTGKPETDAEYEDLMASVGVR